jgi:hypothetical protein
LSWWMLTTMFLSFTRPLPRRIRPQKQP